MEKYEPLGVVGEGSYGVVLKCKCRDNGRTVAIKKFIDSEDDQNVRKIALREIRVLRKLRHENLVNLIEVFRRRKHIYLVFEFIDHTLLDELEQKSHGLDEETCRKYVYQILRGLNFCHENNIIHRDVKPENVLVSKNGIVKLCDFGFARNMTGPGEVFTDYVATRWYRAPELLVGDIAYGKEVDVWALGCLFAEMMTGEPLFPGDSDIDQLFLIAQCLGRLSKRHLNIMQRNSAFRGFQFPESTHSRHGSTASTASTKMSKMIAERKNLAGGNNNSNKSSALSTAAHDGSATLGNERIFSGGSITTANNKGGGGGSNGNNNNNSGSSGSRKKRLVSVERSVFSSMFPSWSDETVQFLTLCLDPEPSGRPSCNSLMRLSYFTHDNFPPRFIPELNAKLQLEGRAPISAFSTTKKKRFVSNNSGSSGNVSSSISPTSRSTFNLANNNSNLKSKNPLYQTRGNLSQIEDEPLSLTNTLTHPNHHSNSISDNNKITTSLSSSSISQKVSLQSSNLINFQNNSTNNNPFANNSSQNPFQSQQQHQQQPLKFLNKRDLDPPPPSLLHLEKLAQKEKFFNSNGPTAPRKPSFSMNPEPSLANSSSENSKIPVLLSRKYSDDSIISSNGTLSSGGSPQNITSKSTPNIPEEAGNSITTTTSATLPSSSTLSTLSTFQQQQQSTKEKRLSIQISTPLIIQNQAYQPSPPAQPPSQPKKYSFSFPAATNSVAEICNNEIGNCGEDSNIKLQQISSLSKQQQQQQQQQSTQLPVTTLTFSMNTTAGVSFSQSLVRSPGNVGTSGNSIPGGNVGGGGGGNQTFSMYQKRSSPTTITKPTKSFSINNSSYFPQPSGYGGGGNNGGVNTSLASNFSSQNTFTYQNSMGNSKSLPVTIVGSSMLRNSNHANSNLGSVAESFLPRMAGKNTGMGNKGNNDENIASILSNGSPPKHGTSALMRKREKWDQQSQNGRKFSVFNANYEGN